MTDKKLPKGSRFDLVKCIDTGGEFHSEYSATS